MLPNCTTLAIMNKNTNWKQNAQSEMYDYDLQNKNKMYDRANRCC